MNESHAPTPPQGDLVSLHDETLPNGVRIQVQASDGVTMEDGAPAYAIRCYLRRDEPGCAKYTVSARLPIEAWPTTAPRIVRDMTETAHRTAAAYDTLHLFEQLPLEYTREGKVSIPPCPPVNQPVRVVVDAGGHYAHAFARVVRKGGHLRWEILQTTYASKFRPVVLAWKALEPLSEYRTLDVYGFEPPAPREEGD